MTVRWLTAVFHGMLAELNRVLDHVGFATRDWAITAIERRDLPAVLPVLLLSSHSDENLQPRASTFPIPLHNDMPYFIEMGEPSPDPVPIETAIAMVTASNRGRKPFEGMFRFLRAANSERIAGDATRCVVGLATAMELLFSQLIATAGPVLGWDQARIDRANRDATGLRGRVADHLGPLLTNAQIDVADTTSPWGEWWAKGYALRNEAVHDGRRLDDDDVRAAWRAASRLLVHITAVLRMQRDLEWIADELAFVALGTDDPPWLDLPLPVAIDWF
ncbi:MAG TPA: hypothetical protein VGG41_12960 [Solirubrobacteraceae bacterium]|jgi:hypothetical protein